MPEERKLVTVLFADIVGSTGHAREHDPEIVRRALSDVFSKVRTVLESHGGTVEKFIGDAVMAVFGAPVAHEDDAQRALYAAFALRDEVRRFNERSPYPIAVRVGVNSGDVVTGSGGSELLVTGEVVIAASRLEQAAEPGELLAGPLTRRLTEGSVIYGPSRAINAKGIGTIEAAPAEALTGALPERRRGRWALTARLIGREDEMRVLSELFRRVVSERTTHLVTIFGAAGVGKSRMVAEFTAGLEGAHILQGRSLPFGATGSLYALQQILRADTGVSADDPPEVALTKLRSKTLDAFAGPSADADAAARRVASAAGLLSLDEALRGIPPEAHADEIHWGVRRYLEQRAAGLPLVLVFEDLHWAEAGLLDLVEHLAEWARGPIFLLCLARQTLLESRSTWGGGLLNATTMSLDPLSAAETRELVDDLLHHDPLPPTLQAELLQRAAGNPLYVEEFVGMLLESGRIERRDQRWVVTDAGARLELPATLQALIAARLDALPTELKRLLQTAAVVGRGFSDAAVASLSGNGIHVREVLREAIRRDLIAERDERDVAGGRVYRFKHILIRDVAYDSLPKAERMRLHEASARWLRSTSTERPEEHLEDLAAYHAERAFQFARELRDPAAASLGPLAFSALKALADRAAHRRQLRRSLELYERSLQIATVTEVAAAERFEVEAWIALARSVMVGSAEAVAALDGVISRARADGPSRLLARLLLTRAGFMLDESDQRARTLYEEALSTARAVGDPDLIAEAMFAPGGAARRIGDLRGQTRIEGEALAYARSVGATNVPQILASMAGTYSQTGEWTRAQELTKLAYREAVAAGSKLTQWRAAFGLANGLLHSRELSRARALAEEAVALARELGGVPYLAYSCWVLGLVMNASGEFAGAREILEEGLGVLGAKAMGSGVHRSQLHSALAASCLKLGDEAAARRSADLLPDDSPIGLSVRHRTLAEVEDARGDAQLADEHFRRAIEAVEGTDWQRTLAEHRLAYARFLVARSRGDEARPLLEAAKTFYSDPLASAVRREIETLLLTSAVPAI